MTTPSPAAESRVAGNGRAALRRLRALSAGLGGLVVTVLLLGPAAGVAAVAVLEARGHVAAVLTVGWAPAGLLVPALFVLTCLADSTAVRLQFGDQVEELQLVEAAVLVNALLLPPSLALLVSTGGVLLSEAARRRQPVKAGFNIGNLMAASGVLILAVRLCAGDATTFTPGLVAGVLLGTALFVVLNLMCLSALFRVIRGTRTRDFLREEARLSALMVVGTAAVGSTAVVLAQQAPLLLPFAAMPAAALMYAYGSVKHESDERNRSSSLLEYSRTVAASTDREGVLSAFLAAAHTAFTVDAAYVVFEDGTTVPSVDPAERACDQSGGADLTVLRDVPTDGALLLDTGLPFGWRGALVAPLEAEGRRLGAVVLGARRRKSFGTRDRTLLTPLANALTVALLNRDHLAQVVEESGKLRAVVDQASDGIVVLDGAGVVHLWNPAVARVTGRPESEADGRPLAEVLDAHDAQGDAYDVFAAAWAAATPSSRHVVLETHVLRPDGETRVLRLSVTAIFDDEEPVRYVVIAHDLTREWAVERMKADFIATVSHELRTPLTPIKGYADLLARKSDQMTPEKRAQCLAVIVDRAAHLGRLVEDLLVASRMSAGKESERSVSTTSADLGALCRRAVEDFGESAARVSLVVPDQPVLVECDPVRTVQVLGNLVGNALKYSPDGSPVVVRVDGSPVAGTVSVQDSGRGLPEDQLERVFEKFHRVEDPAVMTTSGTGLGLFIARNLARAMSGDVRVASTLGVGSVFTLVLPASDGGDGAARAGQPSREPASRP